MIDRDLMVKSTGHGWTQVEPTLLTTTALLTAQP